jgi:lipopolysaccharide/colanic/teichoic acid biosynthesis glycosyltransferase
MKAIPVAPRPKLTIGQRLLEAAYVVFERCFAALALVLGSPILLLEAIAIKIDSEGPVFFHHERAAQSVPMLGKELASRTDLQAPDGGFQPDQLYWVPRPFRFVKFRTMRNNALELYPELYWWNYNITEEEFQHIYHNLDDDPRVTRVGKFLRKTSLDEIVNFWHVLTGECRLVGPRPEIVDILPCYSAEEMRKFTVKPGITCLWAIRGRSELSVKQKNEHDLEYVETRSVWLDLKILALTAWCVLARRGAY